MAFTSTSVVEFSGPLFDNRLESEITAFIELATEDIAKQGVNDVQAKLDNVLVNPSGNYRRHIQSEKQRNDRSVNDSGVIYGPWLEGVGSRNSSSRFKGYSTFRKVSQELQGRVVDLAAPALSKFIGRIN